MYRRRCSQHHHPVGGLGGGRRVVVQFDGSPEQVGGQVAISRSVLCGRKRCEGEVSFFEGIARLQRRNLEAVVFAVSPCDAMEGGSVRVIEREGPVDGGGGAADQPQLVVEYKYFYLADGGRTGLRNAAEAELQRPFAGQPVLPAACGSEQQHDREQWQQLLQLPQGGTGRWIFVFIHFIILLQILMVQKEECQSYPGGGCIKIHLPVIPGLTRDRILH